jgi:hypothetical protein
MPAPRAGPACCAFNSPRTLHCCAADSFGKEGASIHPTRRTALTSLCVDRAADHLAPLVTFAPHLRQLHISLFETNSAASAADKLQPCPPCAACGSLMAAAPPAGCPPRLDPLGFPTALPRLTGLTHLGLKLRGPVTVAQSFKGDLSTLQHLVSPEVDGCVLLPWLVRPRGWRCRPWASPAWCLESASMGH